MRIYKLIGALAAILAFSALAVAATASAEETLWKWLPGSAKETFKGTQVGEGTLQIAGSGSVECSGGSILLSFKEGTTEVHSELLGGSDSEKEKDATLELVLIHFTGCKALGFAANSLGDATEIILVHAELHNCVINAAKKEFGLLILPLPVHIEVPKLATLILVLEKSLAIAKIESEKESKVNFLITAKQTAGTQEPQLCENGKAENLLATVNGGEDKKAGLAAKYLIEFDKTIDANGQEIMEK